MLVKDLRALISDLDDSTVVLMGSRGIIRATYVRPINFYSIGNTGEVEILTLMDEQLPGFEPSKKI
jgi:hypothetical protein